ncbi:MAG: sigma-70 family RNA polymerase sigma factor [Pirellulaceae bacterium]
MRVRQMRDSQIKSAVVRALPRIRDLAKFSLRRRYQSKFDAEDIAQNVARTILRKIRENTFSYDIEDENQLWNLITKIVFRRIAKEIRYLNSQCRDVKRELHLDYIEKVCEVNEFDWEIEDILNSGLTSLSDIELIVLQTFLKGHSKEQIAKRTGLSVRTITRRMNSVIRKLKIVASKLDWGDDAEMNQIGNE